MLRVSGDSLLGFDWGEGVCAPRSEAANNKIDQVRQMRCIVFISDTLEVDVAYHVETTSLLALKPRREILK